MTWMFCDPLPCKIRAQKYKKDVHRRIKDFMVFVVKLHLDRLCVIDNDNSLFGPKGTGVLC